ncbi:MAG: cyclopropane-fatty-acyl-phospholipid synthase family protein [Pseudomonadota bacterium]|nr:cyclopropane-fatty-acyl-phospholipid synthase family protein [Pseudomonadota bacterium]
MLMDSVFRKVIRQGRLNVIDPQGRVFTYGPGGTPRATVRFHDSRILWRMAFSPSLALGEGYMDGRITIEEGTLYDFLDVCTRAPMAMTGSWLMRLRYGLEQPLRRLQQFNPLARSMANVAHHYDLSPHLYTLFLDRDWQYSCAYFPTGTETLEQAQALKKRHLATKLLLKPGQKILDIGSGWGGLGLHLAGTADVHVTGITLSEEQLEHARLRAMAAGLTDRVSFDLRDYRQETEQYDRIVSVGMFEHVGVNAFDTFFRTVGKCLKPDGVAVLHAIGRRDTPGINDPFIRKYIFPGAYAPALSEVMTAVEKSGLWVCDVEVWRLHYAETLRHWRNRFMANRERAMQLYDDRFCRMWEFYLAACEVGFRNLNLMVFQIQLAHQRDAVPLDREYIYRFPEEMPEVKQVLAA